jgi:hypothetical protein
VLEEGPKASPVEVQRTWLPVRLPPKLVVPEEQSVNVPPTSTIVEVVDRKPCGVVQMQFL